MTVEHEQVSAMLQAIDEAEAAEDVEEEGAVYRRPQRPRDPSQVYSVRVPVTLLEDLRVVAEREGVTASALVRRLVVEGVGRLAARPTTMDQLLDRVAELEEREARREKELDERLTKLEAVGR